MNNNPELRALAWISHLRDRLEISKVSICESNEAQRKLKRKLKIERRLELLKLRDTNK